MNLIPTTGVTRPRRSSGDRPRIIFNMVDTPSTLPDFNPSKSEVVDGIKSRTEELMAYIRDNAPDNRCRSIAMTNYEQAAMWAVKANFT